MIRVPPNLSSPSAVPTIAPLERLILPPHLDGSILPRGNSLFEVRIEVHNDLEAIDMWLTEVAKSQSCLRGYRLEAERCLLWATTERDKPLTGINEDDIRDYGQFLLDPRPRERWVCVGIPRRKEESWRPFRGGLSPRSSDRALKIISSLFEWLEIAGYLRKNPWHGSAKVRTNIDKKNTAPALVLERRANVITLVEWSYIKKALDELEADRDEYEAARIKAVVYLAYFADMKPSEICSLRISAFSVLAAGAMSIWKLDVESRPPKVREIILLPPVQRAVERHLGNLGITLGAGAPQAACPVTASKCGLHDWTEADVNLSPQSVRLFTRLVFMQATALAQAGGDQTVARRLSTATTHWFKHAFEVHTTQLGIPKNWCWTLLGACWLVPPITRAYLPSRKPLSPELVSEAFADFGGMWQ